MFGCYACVEIYSKLCVECNTCNKVCFKKNQIQSLLNEYNAISIQGERLSYNVGSYLVMKKGLSKDCKYSKTT